MKQVMDFEVEVNSIKTFIDNHNEDDLLKTGLFKNYSIISSSIHRFLPSVKSDNYLEFIKKAQFHRSLSLIDQKYYFLLDHLSILDDNFLIEKLKNESCIISTFHTGSYRLTISYLLKQEIKFVLVTESKFINDQGEDIKKLSSELKNHLELKQFKELEIFSAQDPNLLFNLKSKLNQGYSVVFYIDGNSGVDEFKIDEKKLLNINFLSGNINARKGIAFLSYLTKKSIITIVCQRNSNYENQLTIESLNIDFDNTRNEFIEEATRKIFSKLEDFLLKRPEQWEGWFYIHKFFKLNNEKGGSFNKIARKELEKIDFHFNSENFKLIDINGIYFVLDFRNYSIMEISKEIYLLLSNCNSKDKERTSNQGWKVSCKLLNELVNYDLLKCDVHES